MNLLNTPGICFLYEFPHQYYHSLHKNRMEKNYKIYKN
ncbi:hypothetical protein KIS4809_0818 [Bacillus sp. ZZV12-4809]|nr:hypothetical protein KIS4809_0818 [Bacillus sp. ZZV12-4809]